MKTFKNLLVCLFSIAVIFSCKEDKKNQNEDNNTTDIENKEEVTPEIKIQKLDDSPGYSDAELVMNSPSNTTMKSGGEGDFNFTINNYTLGAQTESTNAKYLANSGKGQHIHFILNNQPYSAHYTGEFKKEIPEGVHHLVAFLSRSYHESVKNENSVVVKKFEVGNAPENTLGLDMDAPTLIYSRPKGTYVGKDTENLLLDFFVLNTTLSETGNKVRATINDKEFTITEWAPHVVRNLPMGEVKIKLELVDNKGKLIEGPFNSVTRTVVLKAEEAI